MILTIQQMAFFRALSKTDTGRDLLAYLKEVQDFAYDSRSWKEGDTKESAAHAARLIQELIIDKIRPHTEKTDGGSTYE